jgi:protein phosphatase 1L
MEDCYDIKLTKIDEQPVNLFGVFDGIIFSLGLISL